MQLKSIFSCHLLKCGLSYLNVDMLAKSYHYTPHDTTRNVIGPSYYVVMLYRPKGYMELNDVP